MWTHLFNVDVVDKYRAVACVRPVPPAKIIGALVDWRRRRRRRIGLRRVARLDDSWRKRHRRIGLGRAEERERVS